MVKRKYLAKTEIFVSKGCWQNKTVSKGC